MNPCVLDAIGLKRPGEQQQNVRPVGEDNSLGRASACTRYQLACVTDSVIPATG